MIHDHADEMGNVSQVLKVTESMLKETFMIIQSNHHPSTTIRTPKPQPQCLSRSLLDISRDCDSTSSNLLQYLTTLSVNFFFLVSNLNLPCIFSPETQQKSLTPPISCQVEQWGFPLSLFCSRLNNPWAASRKAFSRPFTSALVLLWTFHNSCWFWSWISVGGQTPDSLWNDSITRYSIHASYTNPGFLLHSHGFKFDLIVTLLGLQFITSFLRNHG